MDWIALLTTPGIAALATGAVALGGIVVGHVLSRSAQLEIDRRREMRMLVSRLSGLRREIRQVAHLRIQALIIAHQNRKVIPLVVEKDEARAKMHQASAEADRKLDALTALMRELGEVTGLARMIFPMTDPIRKAVDKVEAIGVPNLAEPPAFATLEESDLWRKTNLAASASIVDENYDFPIAHLLDRLVLEAAA